MATKHPQSAPPTSSSDSGWQEDEIMRELYAQREEHAARFGYDPKLIHEDLVKSAKAIQKRKVKSAS